MEEFSDREMRAWKEGKNRSSSHERPKLTKDQRVQFLKLMAKMSGNATFERELNLRPSDVEFYKKDMDVESADEARRLAKRFAKDLIEASEAEIIAETKKMRQAEAIANERLRELDEKRNTPVERKKVDVNKMKEEDAARQRLHHAQQEKTSEPSRVWHLPDESRTQDQRLEEIDRFRREILYRGLSFCHKKYDASAEQIKFEAKSLGLKINWDMVRR